MVCNLWKAATPLKVKIYLWQLSRNRLSSSQNIAKRHDPSIGNCVICSVVEDANHIFFHCPLARYAWSVVREAAGLYWDPTSSSYLFQLLDALRGGPSRVMWRWVVALLWSLWKIRNKITIESIFPSHPADCLFKMHLFLQQWRPFGKQKEGDLKDVAINKIKQV